jgi:hypothetical protein
MNLLEKSLIKLKEKFRNTQAIDEQLKEISKEMKIIIKLNIYYWKKSKKYWGEII